MTKTTTILLVGVGGQGTILAADLLAKAASYASFDVKVSEIHGMAQRGGSVNTVVRIGEEVHSMVSDFGRADIVVAFETTEALRALPYKAPEGVLIVNDRAIKPQPVLTGLATMPADAYERIVDAGGVIIPASAIAQEVGNAHTENVALLGALSSVLDIEEALWLRAIREGVPPRTIEVNSEAFIAGRCAMNERKG